LVQKRSSAQRKGATAVEEREEKAQVATTGSSALAHLSSLLGASDVQDVQASVGKGGLSSSVSFSYAGKKWHYPLSAFSVFAEDAEVRYHTDRGLETRKHEQGSWEDINRGNFKSRADGRWASAMLRQDGDGMASVTGLFQVQGGIVRIQPLDKDDKATDVSLLAMAKGKSNAHTFQRFNISAFFGDKDHATRSNDPELADAADSGRFIPYMSSAMTGGQLLSDRSGSWTGERWWPDCYPGDDALNDFKVGVVADVAAVERHGSLLMAGISDIFTEASFIYEHQLNIRLVIGHATVYETSAGAPSWAGSEANCVPMSDQLDGLVADSDTFPVNGATHLFTGCNLGNPAGIAYVGTLCNDHWNKGVNQFITTRDWLIFAHELGHNFGGRHSFEEGQGKTGGIMDYGEGTLNGAYQFNTEYRKTEMCQKISSVVRQCRAAGNFEVSSFVSPAPTPAPTPRPCAKVCHNNGCLGTWFNPIPRGEQWTLDGEDGSGCCAWWRSDRTCHRCCA
jgi:hypothetical protein